MNPDNRSKLRNRVVSAAESALTNQGYVRAVDILTGIGWLDLATLKRWKQEPGPACLSCVGLASLEFLPAGDAALSRCAKAKSAVYAVVVRFSRSRKRYERQGLLVPPEALRNAEQELAE
jgi:hypothetical protein